MSLDLLFCGFVPKPVAIIRCEDMYATCIIRYWESQSMEILISEYWSPARVAARSVSGFVAPALLLAIVATFTYAAVSG